MSSINVMGATKSEMDLGRESPAPTKVAGYDRYLAQGPMHSDIEMTRLNVDQVPLLNAPQRPGIFDPMASRSNTSLSTYSPYGSPALDSTPHLASYPAMPTNTDYREASLHRQHATLFIGIIWKL